MKKIFAAIAAGVALALPALAFADDTPIRAGIFSSGNYSMFIMLGLAVLFFYFIILRPERKRRKAMDEKRNAMKKGDRITTSTGIRATIFRIDADSVIVKLYDGAKMELLKAAIMDIQPGTAETATDDKTVAVVESR
jgi:preprotein translocase subunit YajC